MKKLSLLMLAGAGFLVQAKAQVLFSDDFQATSLDNYLSANTASVWTLYNDDNQPVTSPDMSYFDQAWKILRDSEGSTHAASLSYFQQPAKADRWMVSPEIDLADASAPMLVFRAKAADANNRDGFEVRLSENGVEKDDFTTVLESQRQARSVWTYYYIDLKEYQGKKIHLAFVQNSDDCSVLCVDDIIVYSTSNQLARIAELSMATTLLSGSAQGGETQVKASLLNLGEETITSFTLCYRVGEGETQKKEFTAQNIAAQGKGSIYFDLPLPSYGKNTVEVWAENINGGSASTAVSQTFVYQVYEPGLPRQNTLIELFSSGTCSACVGWNKVLHTISLNNQANVFDNATRFTMLKFPVNIPVAGDPTVTDQTLARSNYYSVYAAPTAIMNGRSFALKNSETIEAQIQDSLASCAQRPVNLGLRAYLKRDGNTFTVHATVETYLPEAQKYRLFVCLIEDSMHHLSPMPNGETDFYHVVRYMMTGSQGQILTPAAVGDSLNYQFEYTFDDNSPRVFSSVENINAVVYLQNTKNNSIIQSSYLQEGYIAPHPDGPEASNQGNLETQGIQARIYPNPSSDVAFLNLWMNRDDVARIQIFHVSGQKAGEWKCTVQAGENRWEIPSARLLPGLYLVKVETAEGSCVKKLIRQ